MSSEGFVSLKPKESSWAAIAEEEEQQKQQKPKKNQPAWGATEEKKKTNQPKPKADDEFPGLDVAAATAGKKSKASSRSSDSESSSRGPSRGADRYDDRRGGYDDRRGGSDRYDDRRGGYDSRRGGSDRYDDRRGGYDDRRGGSDRYDDRRGGYDDRRGGYDSRGSGGYDREPREPTPFPTSPPWTAFCGNIPFEVEPDLLGDFFHAEGCKVKDVRIFRGFGYVDFDDAESLKLALEQTDRDFERRRIRVDVSAPKRGGSGGYGRDGPDDRERDERYQERITKKSWRRAADAPPPRREESRYSSSRGDRGDRRGGYESRGRDDAPPGSRSRYGRKPAGDAPVRKPKSYSRPSSIFGNAKPREEKLAETKPSKAGAKPVAKVASPTKPGKFDAAKAKKRSKPKTNPWGEKSAAKEEGNRFSALADGK